MTAQSCKTFIFLMISSDGAMQGVLHMSKRNSQEGSVHVGSQGTSLMSQILIKGKACLNRAMHGDLVAGIPHLAESG